MNRKLLLLLLLNVCLSYAATAQILITTICGDGTSGNTPSGYTATGAWIAGPQSAVKAANGNIYFTEFANHLVRVITPAGVLNTIAGNGAPGYSGDGGLAINASVEKPGPLAVDNAGNVYFIDQFRSVIRRIDAATGIITTFAGANGYGYSGDGGLVGTAKFSDISELAFDNASNLYIGCYMDGVIRKVDMSTGIITRIAGHPTDPGFGGDGGPATAAWVMPWGMDIDNAGNIYLAEIDRRRVRKITAATGIITTIGGTGANSYTGDGGPATAATFRAPYDVAVDNAGNIYVSDYFDAHVIRKINPAGIISTYTGTGTSGYNGDDIAPETAQVDGGDISVDDDGTLYISDLNNSRIRKIYCREPLITRHPGGTTICAGSNTQFSITANFATGYQWQVNTGAGWTNIIDNAIYSGATTATLTITAATGGMNNYQYRCQPSNSCSSLFSSPALLQVATSSATITIASQPKDIIRCTPGSGFFEVVAVNATGYRWQVNDGSGWTDITDNANYSQATWDQLILTGITAAMGGYQYRCRISNLCSQVFSNVVSMQLRAPVTPAVSITASATTVCAGVPVTFTAHPVNSSSGFYTWYRNGVTVPERGDTYQAVLNNGDFIRCDYTAMSSCVTVNLVTSNTITVTVTPAPAAPSVSITASSRDICEGTAVTFTATAVNGGTAPAYQWKKNGINVGTNSTAYTDNTLKRNDVITCEYTSTSPCRINIVTSNSITMSVNTAGSPTAVAILGCITDNGSSPFPGFPWPGGYAGTFTAVPVNGGPAPTYQWKLNGANVGANSATYTNGTLSENDIISCELISNSPCATVTTATSSFTVVVFAAAPSISISTTSANVCAGTASFTATTTNAGSSPTYQWKKNGINVGTNSNTYTDNSLNDRDKISCVLTSYTGCSPAITGSNIYTVNCPVCVPASVITVMGNGTPGFTANGQPAGTGRTNNPAEVIIGNNGNLYFTEYLNERVRMIDPAGNLVTIAGGGTVQNGAATNVAMYSPSYITMDNAGNIYLVDMGRLKKIDAAGIVSTLNLGTGFISSGDGGPLNQASFTAIRGITVDNAGNLYICDGGTSYSNFIRKVDAVTGIVSTIAGTGHLGNTGDGGPATAARITFPLSPVIDNAGNIFFISGNTIRKIDPAGIITTIAGTAIAGNTGDGGPATAATLNQPTDLALDNAGNIYVSSYTGGIVRKITPDGIINHYVTIPPTAGTVSGNCIAIDNAGNLYFSDNLNHTIKKVPCLSFTIARHPVDTAICSSPGNARFSVAACNNPQYQWQVNNGSGWTNISNNAIYSGATTSVLDITGATIAMTAYKYRCKIYNQCHETFSNAATLLVRATTETNYLAITSPISPVCAGSRTVFTATPQYEVPSPVYQWTKNGVNVGTNSRKYEDRTLAPGDVIVCIMTSTGGCVTNPIVTSNIIPMGVDPVVTPTVTITTPSVTVCSGTPVTFTANITHGGDIPLLQWQKNGFNVGTNTTYTDNALNTGDVIRCILTSNAPCTLPPQVFSNNIVMTVNAAPAGSAPTIVITPSANTICAGTNVTFTAAITNGGATPVYQWKKNGINVGANSATYSDNTLAQGDIITCAITSSAACIVTPNATSNTVVMVVNPVFTPTLSVAASANTICAGTNVTFTASGTNTGVSPVYQWKKNGVNVGTNSITYADNTLANGDIISCVLTSSAGCITTPTANSNSITTVVNTMLVPAVTITGSANNICAGTAVTFTATPVNGGATPAYQWKKNGVNVGTNSATYTDNGLVQGDIITCMLTSNATCITTPTATSNTITMVVSTPVAPTIVVSAPATTICAATTVTFTAAITNGGAAPIYQWKKNGINVGANSSTYSDNTLVQGDIISCVLTSNANCVPANTATSNNVIVVVNPLLTPAITITASANNVCSGTSITFTATPVNGGPAPLYQWKKNGVNAGINSSTYTDNTLVNGDVVSCVLTSNAGCVTMATATSNAITMTINPVQVPGISITSPATTICAGTAVTFTATATNAGATPVYQWKKNGNNVGINSTTYADNGLNNNDIITCTLTPGYACAVPATTTSNGITMTVNPVVSPSVTITTNTTGICTGQQASFTAVAANAGNLPVYQWRKNGSPVGTSSATYTDNSIITGDIITCSITSNAGCTATPTATSNSLIMTVHANPVVTLDPTNTLCIGSTRTLDAGNFTRYLWNDGSTGRTLRVNNTGTYSVTVVDNNGCSGGGSTTISTLLPQPSGFLGADTAICPRTSITIISLANYKGYLWSTGSTSSSTTINQPGNYWLEVTDNNNCKGREDLLVSEKQCLKGVFVPNSFTPGTDGKNDIFKPIVLGVVKQYQFQVYNRWGQLVFQSGDASKGWDGSFKGQPAGSETFVWVCKYQLEGEAVKIEKGTVVLIRK